MKIAVVGTSNSILANGYFPVYQALEYPHQVDNFSLGASFCQYIPFALEKFALSENYDLILTDCCPNDGAYFPYARTPDWLYNELHSIFSHIRELPLRHLHLIFPTELETAVHEKIHQQVCEELEIPYLHISGILKNTNKQTKPSLFADKMHINPFYAKQVAFLVKQKTNEVLKNPTPPKKASICRHKEYFIYSLTEHKEFSQVTRATSLRSENFIQLKNNQEICLENLPPCNLESLYFYTNIEAGYYHLSTKNTLTNYNLAYHLANCIFLKPIPANTFKIDKFLKIKAGFNPACEYVMEEYNFPPKEKNNSELLLNALLLSKEINQPLAWQEKNLPSVNEKDLNTFGKIYHFINNIEQYKDINAPISDEFILIGAMLYPKHAMLRKRFIKILKHSAHPYYACYFAKLYLIPRKKYTMAAKLLEFAITLKKDISFQEILAACYLEQNKFAKAETFIQQEISEEHAVIRLKLLILLARKTQNKMDFVRNAQKFLDYGATINHLVFLAENCLAFQEIELAKEFLDMITSDSRNFHHEEDRQKITALTQKINTYR